MSRLNDRQIAEYLLEEIPSGIESNCSDEDNEEDPQDHPNSLVLGDLIGEVPVTDFDNFDPDDDIPLSSLVCENPDTTESTTINSDRPTIKAPKWKKNYRMDIPGPASIKRHKPTVPQEIRLECSRHQPERSTSRRCCKCSTKISPVRTVWQCNTCKVPLCLRKGKTCFADFHKK
ncbi:uncharacterized protein LOC126379617 [Pectinophora gossypiella]|uniref:uncharacterized protein LOC126379617 n=1 Tax=Pectinophora gossypiella TaxID=13191 RepID=UPI00214E7085|nr:uncharacterized protein LOC126379617 [Pectinophora gossypiella]